jgi:hypothetical protein
MTKKKKKKKQVKKKRAETEARDSQGRFTERVTDAAVKRKIGTSGTGPRLF